MGRNRVLIIIVGMILSICAMPVAKVYAVEDTESVAILSEAEAEIEESASDVIEEEYFENNTYNDGELPVATDLQWESAGWVSFIAPKTGVYYVIKVIMPDGSDEIYAASDQTPSVDGERMYFNVCRDFVDEGDYSFAIKTVASFYDNFTDFDNGSVTAFNNLRYDRPSEAYAAPENLRWSSDGTVHWDSVDGAKYILKYYRNGKKWFTYYISNSYYLNRYIDVSKDNWTFSVIAYGDHPDEKAASQISEMSPAYDSSSFDKKMVLQKQQMVTGTYLKTEL